MKGNGGCLLRKQQRWGRGDENQFPKSKLEEWGGTSCLSWAAELGPLCSPYRHAAFSPRERSVYMELLGWRGSCWPQWLRVETVFFCLTATNHSRRVRTNSTMSAPRGCQAVLLWTLNSTPVKAANRLNIHVFGHRCATLKPDSPDHLFLFTFAPSWAMNLLCS